MSITCSFILWFMPPIHRQVLRCAPDTDELLAGFRFSDKNIFETFKSIGVPVGKKYEYLVIPDKFEDLNLFMAFLRGLFDTDCNLYFSPKNGKTNHYPVLSLYQSSRELIFENCRIPKENIISKEGMGFIVAMRTLDSSRTGVGAQGVGVAQGAFEAARDYAKERQQFGQPVISFQAIQHILADMATQIEAARALVYSVARYIDSGAKDVSKESAMAKLFASEIAEKCANDAVQIFGGYGFIKDYPVEKFYRDVKLLTIGEGTSEIQRIVIARDYLK